MDNLVLRCKRHLHKVMNAPVGIETPHITPKQIVDACVLFSYMSVKDGDEDDVTGTMFAAALMMTLGESDIGDAFRAIVEANLDADGVE